MLLRNYFVLSVDDDDDYVVATVVAVGSVSESRWESLGDLKSPCHKHRAPSSTLTLLAISTGITETAGEGEHSLPLTTIMSPYTLVLLRISTMATDLLCDGSETFCVGEVDEAGKKLVKVTYDAWQVGGESKTWRLRRR